MRFVTAGLLVLVLALGAFGAPDRPLVVSVVRLDGKSESLTRYAGQVVLIVNVASKCALTHQYEGLEALYERYRERGLVVLGFPSNDFEGEEPGSNQEIAEFCRANWGVKFPMYGKLHVSGPEQHPLYAHLTQLPVPLGGPVEGSFQKYLVARDGRVVDRLAPEVEPLSDELVHKIEILLDEQQEP
ncbi:MAG: glutathione peroxidase [Deltaproteobacteria bacterium]|nr:glutathione peroxidase [Deltaproteobacteria bacterium]